MRVYNLTDRRSDSKEPQPQVLRAGGIVVLPGSYVDIPDEFPLKRIAAWLYSERASVNSRPGWYAKARAAAVEATHERSKKKRRSKKSKEK